MADNSSTTSNLIVVIKPTTYYSNFSNTDLLPVTPIINTIEEEYPSFLSNPENKNLTLQDIFNLDYENKLQPSIGNYKGTNIKNKSSFSLEKLITYLIYTKSSFLLEEKNNTYEFNLAGIKSQIGKDISRLDLYVNDQRQNFSSMLGGDPETPENSIPITNRILTPTIKPNTNTSEKITKVKTPSPPSTPLIVSEDKSKYAITDSYYEILMDNDPGKKVDDLKLINFNIMNEVGILSCQNIFNFIAELVQLEIKNIAQSVIQDSYLLISPSSKQDANGKSTIADNKELLISLKEKEKKVTIYFDSYLFNSDDFSSVGRITFIMSLDLLLNTFQFDTLDIEYNLESMVSPSPIDTKPTYTMAQTAKYYGITKPSRFFKKRMFSSKGGKQKKTKKIRKQKKTGNKKSMKIRKPKIKKTRKRN